MWPSKSNFLQISACPEKCFECPERQRQPLCKRFCSKHGWCGSSDAYKNGGTDCTVCSGKL